jgi:hypothetical protein
MKGILHDSFNDVLQTLVNLIGEGWQIPADVKSNNSYEDLMYDHK